MTIRTLHSLVLLTGLSVLPGGCVVDTDTGADVKSNPDVSSTEQGLTLPLTVTCPDAPGCFFTSGQVSYRVRAEIPPPTLVGLNSWLYPRGSEVIAGCGTIHTFCELNLKASCAQTAPGSDWDRRIVPIVNQRFVVLPLLPEITWLGTIDIPSDGCMLQACTAPPSGAPVLTLHNGFCRGRHSRTWTSVAGATYYQMQAKPEFDYNLGIGPSTPWANIPLSNMYPGIVVDTTDTRCPGNSSSNYFMRVRACNDCGCSAWSSEQYFQYWSGPCA